MPSIKNIERNKESFHTQYLGNQQMFSKNGPRALNNAHSTLVIIMDTMEFTKNACDGS